VEKCSLSCLLCPLPYSLLYQPKSLTGLGILILYSHYLTLQSTTPSPFTLPIVNTVLPAPLSLTCNGSSHVLSHGFIQEYLIYSHEVFTCTSTVLNMWIIQLTNIQFTLNFKCNNLAAQPAASLGISDIFLGGVYTHANCV